MRATLSLPLLWAAALCFGESWAVPWALARSLDTHTTASYPSSPSPGSSKCLRALPNAAAFSSAMCTHGRRVPCYMKFTKQFYTPFWLPLSIVMGVGQLSSVSNMTTVYWPQNQQEDTVVILFSREELTFPSKSPKWQSLVNITPNPLFSAKLRRVPHMTLPGEHAQWFSQWSGVISFPIDCHNWMSCLILHFT